jgi:hypothetical protein
LNSGLILLEDVEALFEFKGAGTLTVGTAMFVGALA